MRDDNRRSAEQAHQQHSAADVRDALLALSGSLEQLLPVIEAARVAEAMLRASLARLTPAFESAAPVTDWVPVVDEAHASPAEDEPDTDTTPYPAQTIIHRHTPPDDEEGPREAITRSIAVVISGPRGPVDLSRVHAALNGIPGVENLRLGRYDRSGVVIYVETARDPDSLPFDEALAAVFDEGVTGRWASDEEYTAIVGAA